MKKDNDKYNLIDRYFEDDLDTKESQDFQTRLADDADLADAFEMEGEVIQGIDCLLYTSPSPRDS